MTRSQFFLKGAVDLTAAWLGLTILIAPLAIVALLIRLTSRGPALFIQLRVGRHGRLFRCVKFRTMRADAGQERTVTTIHDPRITPLGRVLRRFKVDELPQLWNVLLGDMSLVGPRPDVPGYADRLQGTDRRLLELRPGITGPASLSFRREDEILAMVTDPQAFNDAVIFPKKVKMNLEYLEGWAFWKDLAYVAATVFPPFIPWAGLPDPTCEDLTRLVSDVGGPASPSR